MRAGLGNSSDLQILPVSSNFDEIFQFFIIIDIVEQKCWNIV